MRQPARPPGLPTRHARRDRNGSDQPQCRMAHDPVAHTAPRARPKVRQDHPRSPNRSASRRTASALTELSRSIRSPIRCQLWDTTRNRFSTIQLKESLTWEYLQFSSAHPVRTDPPTRALDAGVPPPLRRHSRLRPTLVFDTARATPRDPDANAHFSWHSQRHPRTGTSRQSVQRRAPRSLPQAGGADEFSGNSKSDCNDEALGRHAGFLDFAD